MGKKGLFCVTTEQIERMKELHREFRCTREIAELTGMKVHQVLRFLQDASLKPNPATPKPTRLDKDFDRLKEWASQGISLSEMCRRIGYDGPKHISDYLRKRGVEIVRHQQVGANNPAWKGGRTSDKDGYILVHMPDHPMATQRGRIREHRLVMEKKLGRFLDPNEVVHHIDNDPSNNDPDNLELFETNSAHLAETLKGQVPRWTEDGIRRIQEGIRRPRRKKVASNPSESEAGAPALPGMSDQNPS